MSSTATFLSPFDLSNLTAPASGVTHMAKWTIGLNGGTAKLPLSSQVQQLGVFLAQACTIDNTAGSFPITFAETTTGYVRVINPGEGQTFQFPAVEYPVFTFTSAGAVAFPFFLYDWPAFPERFSNAALASTNVNFPSGTIAVTMTDTPPPAPLTYFAPSATAITTGATSQTLFAAGQITNKGFVRNPATATEPLFVNPVGPATLTESAQTIALAPGAQFDFGPALGAISVNATTTGHAFVAWYS